MHGTSHWLGMNVHDVGGGATFEPGMVFTNEPGIYIREDTLDNLPKTPENQALIAKIRPAFEKYKNIGVRIEDDLLVTPTGVEWMTKNLPRKLEDIEAFMASAPKQLTYGANRFDGRTPTLATLSYVPAVSGSTSREGFVWSGKRAASDSGHGH
jgi:hypothetical protein